MVSTPNPFCHCFSSLLLFHVSRFAPVFKSLPPSEFEIVLHIKLTLHVLNDLHYNKWTNEIWRPSLEIKDSYRMNKLDFSNFEFSLLPEYSFSTSCDLRYHFRHRLSIKLFASAQSQCMKVRNANFSYRNFIVFENNDLTLGTLHSEWNLVLAFVLSISLQPFWIGFTPHRWARWDPQGARRWLQKS